MRHEIQSQINQNLAAIIGASGLDYRVILLSRHGNYAAGQTLDLNTLAVQYRPGGSGAIQEFGLAPSLAECAPGKFWIEGGATGTVHLCHVHDRGRLGEGERRVRLRASERERRRRRPEVTAERGGGGPNA